MGQALYRKYRSKKLSEVIGQDHITKTLSNALKSGKISHAYLLTGPRGVGKTSVARILAYQANGLNYQGEGHHLDIIEIDAASNRRIDEIRDLRDKVHIAPTSGKYKVYIIDEVHMLTKEAFNALLKTLEEPPEHVIFILATTEYHKLPLTIISRTQRFAFKPIDQQLVVAHLSQIAKAEKIEISPEALKLVAQHGEGSFRDSISLLDQASALGKKIELEDVQQLLGLAPDRLIDELVSSISGNSPKQLLQVLDKLQEQGVNAPSTAKQLSAKLRKQLIDGQTILSHQNTMTLLRDLLAVSNSPSPDELLAVTLLDVVLGHIDLVPAPNHAPPAPATPSKKPVLSKVDAPKLQKKPTNAKFSLESWPQALADVKNKHNTLYSILRMCEPSLDGQKLTLEFQFAFHQKQANEPKSREVISDIINHHSSDPIEIEMVVVDKSPKIQTVQANPVSNHIETVSNIFGGGEVLNS